jgi:hypothetical protein
VSVGAGPGGAGRRCSPTARSAPVSRRSSCSGAVGNALGLAVTGVVFFGARHGGFAHAFELSLLQVAVLCVAVGGLTRPLPRPAGAS